MNKSSFNHPIRGGLLDDYGKHKFSFGNSIDDVPCNPMSYWKFGIMICVCGMGAFFLKKIPMIFEIFWYFE